ncbi:hypothetical protein J7I01_004637 [Vibrio parahaemolyticus]|nr:hypothetical protein [Vibrio parahaemolyticus]
MSVLPSFWKQVIIDTAQRLGFDIKGSKFVLDGTVQRAVFFIERDLEGLVIHQRGGTSPRYLMDELDCLDFCQWLRRFERGNAHSSVEQA